ncbi:MAG TPA: ABC transporter permease subunit [Stellaceae bacterium]
MSAVAAANAAAPAKTKKAGAGGRPFVVGVPFAWLAVLFLLPFLIVAAISIAETTVGIPPFTPPVSIDAQGVHFDATLGNYALVAGDSLYWRAYVHSLSYAALATLCCLLVGYPMAYAIASAPQRWRNPLLLLVILPFWTSFLIRVYAWMGLLSPNGLINHALISLGVIGEPLPLINNLFSVELGLVYSYLPFMVLPLYSTLEKLDPALLEAAADLGARPWRSFLTVTLPLSLPGIVAGSLLVFIPAVGEFVIPDLLGGPDTLMIGKVLWDEFFTNRDWPVASSIAVAMLVILAVPIAVGRRLLRGETAS